jgi:DNA primase
MSFFHDLKNAWRAGVKAFRLSRQGRSSVCPVTLSHGVQPDAAVVVEAEFDALLVWQETRGLPVNVAVVGLGFAQGRPDTDTSAMLARAKVVLVALDYDEAGGKEFWGWWAIKFPNSRRWPVPKGKAPGDYYRAGGNVRAWVVAGLMKAGLWPEAGADEQGLDLARESEED